MQMPVPFATAPSEAELHHDGRKTWRRWRENWRTWGSDEG